MSTNLLKVYRPCSGDHTGVWIDVEKSTGITIHYLVGDCRETICNNSQNNSFCRKVLLQLCDKIGPGKVWRRVTGHSHINGQAHTTAVRWLPAVARHDSYVKAGVEASVKSLRNRDDAQVRINGERVVSVPYGRFFFLIVTLKEHSQ